MTVFTDHAPLVGLERKNMCNIKNPRVIRLLEKIAGYRIKIEHIRGSTNLCMHALSRQPMASCKAKDVPRFGKIS